MKRIIPISGVGHVAFPDNMSDQDVQSAAQKLHQQANPKGIEDVIQALVKQEPGPSSKTHEKMAMVAQTLEQHPALLQLAIAGLDGSAMSQSPTESAGQSTQGQPPQQASPEQQSGASSQQPPQANAAA